MWPPSAGIAVHMVEFLSASLFPILMIVAGAGDALSLRIPNWLTAAIALLFFPMALATTMPLDAVLMHAAVGVTLFVAGFVLFALGLFGGGDAKLMAAAGLWFGWPHVMPFLVMTVFAGGLLAVCVIAWSAIAATSEIHGATWTQRLKGLRPDVPYGFAFAAGAILAYPETWWMQPVG